MTTSGASTYNIAVWEVTDEAFERIGQNPGALSGYDAITARRSLNLLIQEWMNKSANLWTFELMPPLQLVANQPIYELDSDTSDILDESAVTRIIQPGVPPLNLDVICHRQMRDEYISIPNKAQTGQRPIYYLLERNRDNPTITFWPVPDGNSNVQFVYYRKRYMQDVDSSSDTLDIPRRFIPAAIAGLAHALAQKSKYQVDQTTRQEIEQEYERTFAIATAEDIDRTSVFLRPAFRNGGRR